MSSLYTSPVTLHKFKYVGGGSDEAIISHKFRFIFQAFLAKYEQQIFLSDVEIHELSKEYTNVFIDKLLRGENKAYIKHHLDKFSEDDKIARNISNQRLFEKQKVSTLNKIKSHIDGNMIKTVKIINKSIKTNLLNDFDRDISFINIFNGDKLTMRMPDGAPSKEAVRKILLTDFNREVVFINKINSNIRRLQNGFGDGIEKVSHEMGRLKLLSNIDRLTMMLNINHSRRLPMISIGTGDDYVATHTKTLYNYTRIATLIDIKRKYSKYLN
jgi:hypothetical protein